MSQRRQLEERLAGLGESGEIIRSMKNLAYMETRKLARLIEHQRGVVRQIDAIAADFLGFYGDTLPAVSPSRRLYLAVGSRRGFCGDFNERLLSALRDELAMADSEPVAVIAVGQRLSRRLAGHVELVASLDGADVAEEIPAVLRSIVNELDAQRDRFGALALIILYQDAQQAAPRIVPLLPPFETQRDAALPSAIAPLLNLAPRDFLLELGEQYVFAALHAVLYESLLAENERRVRHLEGATRHLEERLAMLKRRVQVLRQEEIIEEIEVILLNAAQLERTAASAEDGEDS